MVFLRNALSATTIALISAVLAAASDHGSGSADPTVANRISTDFQSDESKEIPTDIDTCTGRDDLYSSPELLKRLGSDDPTPPRQRRKSWSTVTVTDNVSPQRQRRKSLNDKDLTLCQEFKDLLRNKLANDPQTKDRTRSCTEPRLRPRASRRSASTATDTCEESCRECPPGDSTRGVVTVYSAPVHPDTDAGTASDLAVATAADAESADNRVRGWSCLGGCRSRRETICREGIREFMQRQWKQGPTYARRAKKAVKYVLLELGLGIVPIMAYADSCFRQLSRPSQAPCPEQLLICPDVNCHVPGLTCPDLTCPELTCPEITCPEIICPGHEYVGYGQVCDVQSCPVQPCAACPDCPCYQPDELAGLF